MKENYEQNLITAGGRIKCKRCQARSSRKKQQCGKPAIQGKNVCGTHGGLSTGPKTAEGIKHIQNAHWKHGNETKEARAERSAKSLQFLMLEKIGWHVGLFAEGSTKFRGRKPNGFENLDLNDPEQLALALLKTLPTK
jgi:hypothetical protein